MKAYCIFGTTFGARLQLMMVLCVKSEGVIQCFMFVHIPIVNFASDRTNYAIGMEFVRKIPWIT
eukprot:CAMPEP_0184424954 /NCGR_PEP_ID=MMETSP0738-20130409/122150_1 /TAXON_ID=385413 /ORGANISM="Thalassiosira miniscula, Strain CCMP1093" /LENGTH=63 /DNA_ID=CAMNT_0026787627 /DNA_START=263 /DNA_END=450 /DNA_ORIENTATION=+